MPTHLLKWILLALLTIIWGSSFVLMKEGLLALSPLEVAAVRMCSAAAVLMPFALPHIRKIPREKWKWLAASGIIGNGIPAFLFTLAETHVTSSTAGMLNALSPVFTMIIAWLVVGLPQRPWQVAGVITGMVGAMALIYFQPGTQGFRADPYAWLIVLATLGYGCSVNIIRQHFGGIPAVHAACFAISFAAVPYFVYLLWSEFFVNAPGHELFGRSILSVLTLGIIGSAMATVMFNKLVHISSTLFAASVTYLMPIVSIFLALLYGEALHPMQLVGLAIILGGVYLISLKPKV